MNESPLAGRKTPLAQSPMRSFLDANILFSASFPNSHLADFLGELQHHAAPLTNAHAMAEAEQTSRQNSQTVSPRMRHSRRL